MFFVDAPVLEVFCNFTRLDFFFFVIMIIALNFSSSKVFFFKKKYCSVKFRSLKI